MNKHNNNLIHLGNFRLILTVFSIPIIIFGYLFFYYSPERVYKKEKEITRILDKTYDEQFCEQYALVAVKDSWYPCFRCGGRDSIFLLEGEVWKYGKTCKGESGRYSNGMPTDFLEYVPEFFGTEQECLVEEKRKIYNYPNLPECKKRNFIMLRPAGNKIDR